MMIQIGVQRRREMLVRNLIQPLALSRTRPSQSAALQAQLRERFRRIPGDE